jgi:hypothetical protein
VQANGMHLPSYGCHALSILQLPGIRMRAQNWVFLVVEIARHGGSAPVIIFNCWRVQHCMHIWVHPHNMEG